uniref:Ig-like domain-containing protein n=1 Tax=Haplochromis burtoni TaxID=8153 RepID=A0A3Q2W0W5_HAPBU
PLIRLFFHVKKYLFMCLVLAVIWTNDVTQTPTLLLKTGDSAQMYCHHNLHGSYYHMYWFQQLPGESLRLIVHMLPYKAPDFGNFSQENLRALCSFSEAYFGAGTKLTVLAPNRTAEPPKVKVFKPSTKECQNEKDKKNKKTLLCVASGFYPDHVNVSWQIDGVDVKDGIATDHSAHWNGTHYRITSRLRVLFSQWFKPGKNFTCTVDFFDGEQTVPSVGWVAGIRTGKIIQILQFCADKYLKTTHNAKLSYLVLIIKSSIYGLFVIILVWKLQVGPKRSSSCLCHEQWSLYETYLNTKQSFNSTTCFFLQRNLSETESKCNAGSIC